MNLRIPGSEELKKMAERANRRIDQYEKRWKQRIEGERRVKIRQQKKEAKSGNVKNEYIS